MPNLREPHEFTDIGPDIGLLERLYRELYEREFPDADERESLENIRAYLGKKREGWYGKNNYHVLTLLEDGSPIAISICDYLAEADAGVIEFLAIHPDRRERGAGGEMLALTEKVLSQDAANAGKRLSLVLAEMEDPYKIVPSEEGMDPFARARIWGKWGFSRLDFPYIQPSLGEGKQAVNHLLLLAKPMPGSSRPASAGSPGNESSVATTKVKTALEEYMRWAMRIEHPEKEPVYKLMASSLSASTRVRLIPI